MFGKSICAILLLLTAGFCSTKESTQIQVNDFSAGGISVSDNTGNLTDNMRRARTGFWPLGTITIEWDKEADMQYLIAYYDEDYGLIEATEFQSESTIIHTNDVIGAKYVRFVFRIPEDEPQNNDSFQLPKGCKILASEAFITLQDAPENEGVANALLRAKQCADVSYVTKAVLPCQKGDIEAGTEVTGIMYSSTREESLYVPNAVSFESYITALNDPKSYIYTRVSDLQNSKTYYGTVCSAFVSYCLDLPCIYTTRQLGTLDGIVKIQEQELDNLRLGDLILREGVHVCMIVGIERDNCGRVLSVTESEATKPQVRTKTYSRRGFTERWLDRGYQIYRYTMIDEVRYEYSEWADTDNDTLLINRNLCPKRGNKANWPMGERVEIDIFDGSEYDKVELYKDGMLLSSTSLPQDLCIRYDALDSGQYDVCLTNGAYQSEYVSFIVVDILIQAENLGNQQVKISFSSSVATPKWFAWCYPNENTLNEEGVSAEEDIKTSRDYLAVARAFELTDEDRDNGFVISAYESGTWLFKVEFETKYGLISSEFFQLEIRD